jgi:hypothetical protein
MMSVSTRSFFFAQRNIVRIALAAMIAAAGPR